MKSTFKNIILVIMAPLVLVLILYVIGKAFSPGSYPYAEIYEFNISEDSLIQIIDQIRNENPSIAINETDRVLMTYGFYEDGRHGDEHWYHIYFYYHDTKEVVHTWVRGNSKVCTFAFYGLTNLVTDEHVTINDGYWPWSYQSEIEKFEHLILEKIKEKTQPNIG